MAYDRLMVWALAGLTADEKAAVIQPVEISSEFPATVPLTGLPAGAEVTDGFRHRLVFPLDAPHDVTETRIGWSFKIDGEASCYLADAVAKC